VLGSGVGSNLNANALPFNENHFSEKHPSYSDAVSRKRKIKTGMCCFDLNRVQEELAAKGITE
jgi:hypothetical protein